LAPLISNCTLLTPLLYDIQANYSTVEFFILEGANAILAQFTEELLNEFGKCKLITTTTIDPRIELLDDISQIVEDFTALCISVNTSTGDAACLSETLAFCNGVLSNATDLETHLFIYDYEKVLSIFVNLTSQLPIITTRIVACEAITTTSKLIDLTHKN
jgi:hypothetical protein